MTNHWPGRITFVETATKTRNVVRSRLEARWVTLFNALELSWEYEPQQFILQDGRRYTPDFYIDEVGWIEIKATAGDARRAEEKLRAFAREKDTLIGESRRKEFYTIVGTQPEFDIHRFHRWDPSPTEIYWAVDIYLLFCGAKMQKTAARFGLHPIEWLKWCLAKAQSPIDPLRPIAESVFTFLHHELGTSFQTISRAVKAGGEVPSTSS